MARHSALVAATALLLATTCAAALRFPAPRNDTVTVSGISAGGFMAVQFEVAFSSLVKGAGVVAGGPYTCSGGSEGGASECMFIPEMVSLANCMQAIQSNYAAGSIDNPANIASHSVGMFSGTLDSLVAPATMKILQQMYQQLNVSDQWAIFNVTAEHAWITDDWGNSCVTLGSPYINNCGIDFAKEFLSGAFHNMGLHWNNTKGEPNYGASGAAGSLYEFSQAAYGANAALNSMSAHGYAYVPERCRTNGNRRCHVHVSFHGCKQDAGFVGHNFVKHTKLNQWAESNGIIVLYPQAAVNEGMGNPYGCYDWWGYTNGQYAVQAGAQMAMVRQMLTEIFEGRLTPKGAPTPAPLPPGPPGPTSGPTTPPAPASCSALPDGTSCVSSSSYIVCPVGLTFQCTAGTSCMGSNGEALCL